MTDFFDSVKLHFRFLETEYDCILESCNKDKWEPNVVYSNASTGIVIIDNLRDQIVSIYIYKLVNGKRKENPNIEAPDSEFTTFGFADLLPTDARIKPAYEYPPNSSYFDGEFGVSNYVEEFAILLKEYGDDVLRGDFSILPKMARIMKKRAADYS